ncbi:Zinc finger, C3HC4 type (RING finger) [Musa troglodytarum]|uniref:RING-type E3 ubiquitin transferase n=1 Tax=Musa troglodytarum TaxID=320322 RepID=A0A9E7FEY1_9LILI|nr:Zinc finger, C3HC4 type (RING finger) [Musa troglodytarum]
MWFGIVHLVQTKAQMILVADLVVYMHENFPCCLILSLSFLEKLQLLFLEDHVFVASSAVRYLDFLCSDLIIISFCPSVETLSYHVIVVAASAKMMRLETYAGFSFLATISAIYYAFSSRGQFYPAMVYLSTSKICFVLLLNMGLVIMCIMWQLVKRLFLGSLREAEVERLNEQSWREVMDILFAITIFRQDFSVTFLAMVTALLLIKALHWLAQKRVEYIETTPSVSPLSHMRIVSFMIFLLLLDCLFLYNSLSSLIQTRQASVALFFSFESYGIPLHLIRELYETFRSFRLRVADYVRYRKITSNMNERFPDATQEELNATDATCIICREEMVTAKKLLCGHLFHVHCLRSWLERQHTCPTCRALVVPPENGQVGSARHHGTPSESNQPVGSAMEGASSQGLSDGAGGANLSRHQARLQAAAMAASLYEKSFSYLPASCASNRMENPHLEAFNGVIKQPTGEAAASGQSLQFSTHPRSIPFLASDFSIASSQTSSSNQDVQLSLLKAHEDVIRSQIQTQLQALEQQAAYRPETSSGDVVPAVADLKGKSVITSDAATSKPDGSQQEESEKVLGANIPF